MPQTTALAFRIQRRILTATVLTAITPPIDAREVLVGNGTAALLQIHTNSDGTEFLNISAGVERPFRASLAALLLYRRNQTAFWLRSTPGGLVILTWTP